jgi:hypothetical protein
MALRTFEGGKKAPGLRRREKNCGEEEAAGLQLGR